MPPKTIDTDLDPDAHTDLDVVDDGWPAHAAFDVPWSPLCRGPRADRMLRSVTSSVPPEIGPLVWRAGSDDRRLLRTAARAVSALEQDAGHRSGALGAFLVRTESIASSRIEHVHADVADYARALAGSRANTTATTMVAGTRAATSLLDRVGQTGIITLDMLLDAHRRLFVDDPGERAFAGRLRTVQNWIGGSDHSPRDAVHVPPPAACVPGYVDDLLAFANRDDVDPVAQAAIVHAQFECVHPFTDGNGRIGRALLGAVLRRRGLTRAAVVPIASAMVAERTRYFALLDRYRDGDAATFVGFVAECTIRAADVARRSVAALDALPPIWRAVLGGGVAGGSAARALAVALVDLLVELPVLTPIDVARTLGTTEDAARAGIAVLDAAGIVAPLVERRRDPVWCVPEVLAELERHGTQPGGSVRGRSALTGTGSLPIDDYSRSGRAADLPHGWWRVDQT